MIVICFLFVFCFFVFFEPNYLGHPDNYIRENSLVTEAQLVPEWYSLPFYAILRCVPSKAGGIFLMFSSILVLLFLPIFIKKTNIRRNYKTTNLFFKEMVFSDVLFFTQVVVFVLLGWIGSQPIARPYVIIGPHLAAYYFSFFFIQMFF